MFEQAAANQSLDWRLLAAVGYQESHWDDHAVSGDGAAGIMMLTEATAKAMGVADRRNAEQNIAGGAAYFAQVLQMIPSHVRRTRPQLAGAGGLQRRLRTPRRRAHPGADAGQGSGFLGDVRQYLPWLAQERWYQQARRGYARGWEPVRFVDQVRGFLAVLEWYGDSPGERAPGSRPVPVVPPHESAALSAARLRREPAAYAG